MGLNIDWGDLLAPLITALVTAIIKAIIEAIENGEFAKAAVAIDSIKGVMDNDATPATACRLMDIGMNLKA